MIALQLLDVHRGYVVMFLLVTAIGSQLFSSSRSVVGGGRELTIAKLLFPFQEKRSINKLPPTRVVMDEWLRTCVADVFSNSTTSRISWKPFKTLRKDYALGDCIRWCQKCDWHDWPENQNYDGKPTILGRYSKSACPRGHPNFVHKGNLKLVDEILNDFAPDLSRNFIKPDPDALVVHLRLGDIIEASPDDVTSMLIRGGQPGYWPKDRYITSIKSFYEIYNNTREAQTKKVILVGGSHRPAFFNKSRVYVHCLSQALRWVGLNVESNVDGGDADADFYYMTHAKQVVLSGGGYSIVIGQMVQRHGGTIVGRTFN